MKIPLINPHVPNSSIVNCRVTINVKASPVIILNSLIDNEIKPEYVTRIPAKISLYQFFTIFLKIFY